MARMQKQNQKAPNGVETQEKRENANTKDITTEKSNAGLKNHKRIEKATDPSKERETQSKKPVQHQMVNQNTIATAETKDDEGFYLVQRKTKGKSKMGANEDDKEQQTETPENKNKIANTNVPKSSAGVKKKFDKIVKKFSDNWSDIIQIMAEPTNRHDKTIQAMDDLINAIETAINIEKELILPPMRRWKLDQINEEITRTRQMSGKKGKKHLNPLDSGVLNPNEITNYLAFLEQEKKAIECLDFLREFVEKLSSIKAMCECAKAAEKSNKNHEREKVPDLHHRLAVLHQNLTQKKGMTPKEGIELNVITIGSHIPEAIADILFSNRFIRTSVENRFGILINKPRVQGSTNSENVQLHGYGKTDINKFLDFVNSANLVNIDQNKDEELIKSMKNPRLTQTLRNLAVDNNVFLIYKNEDILIWGLPENINKAMVAFHDVCGKHQHDNQHRSNTITAEAGNIQIAKNIYESLTGSPSLWRSLLVATEDKFPKVNLKAIGNNTIEIHGPTIAAVSGAEKLLHEMTKSWIIEQMEIDEAKEKLLEQGGSLRTIRNTVGLNRVGTTFIICGSPTAVAEAKLILVDALSRHEHIPNRQPDTISIPIREWMIPIFNESLLAEISTNTGAEIRAEFRNNRRGRQFVQPRIFIMGTPESRAAAASNIRKLKRDESKREEITCEFPSGYEGMMKFLAERTGSIHELERYTDTKVVPIGQGGNDSTVIIRGPKHGISRLLDALSKSDETKNVVVQLPVDTHSLPRVVGRGGSNVRRLQKETGITGISVLPEPPTVVIKGSPAAVERAVEEVKNLVSSNRNPINHATGIKIRETPTNITDGRPRRGRMTTIRGRGVTSKSTERNACQPKHQDMPTPDEFPSLKGEGIEHTTEETQGVIH